MNVYTAAAGDDNVTSLVDTAVTLRCPLAAAAADDDDGSSSRTVVWQKRDLHGVGGGGWRPLARDGDRVRVQGRGGNDLLIDRVLVSDAGFYRCSTTTAPGVDRHSPPVLLTVHGMGFVKRPKFHGISLFPRCVLV